MKASGVKYLVKEGVRNLWSNRVMAFTSVGVLTTCLLIVGAAYLLTVNVSNMVSYVETQSEMSVFLKDFDRPDVADSADAKETEDAKEIKDEEDAKDAKEGTASDAGKASSGDTAPAEATEAEDGVDEGTTESDSLESAKAALRLEMIATIEQQIRANSNVATCEYVSKEQGMENTKVLLGESGYLLDGIKDRNYIPDTFIITVNEIENTAQTKAELEKIEGVDMIMASTEVSDTLTYVQSTVNMLGGAIIIALAIISVVIISNTIRATIFARRKEINIMKFVGATNSFIRIPFLVEGFFLGLISAIISYALIWGGYTYLLQAFTGDVSTWLNSVFENIIPFSDLATELIIFFGVTGTVLGSIGSAISIRNHARV